MRLCELFNFGRLQEGFFSSPLAYVYRFFSSTVRKVSALVRGLFSAISQTIFHAKPVRGSKTSAGTDCTPIFQKTLGIVALRRGVENPGMLCYFISLVQGLLSTVEGDVFDKSVLGTALNRFCRQIKAGDTEAVQREHVIAVLEALQKAGWMQTGAEDSVMQEADPVDLWREAIEPCLVVRPTWLWRGNERPALREVSMRMVHEGKTINSLFSDEDHHKRPTVSSTAPPSFFVLSIEGRNGERRDTTPIAVSDCIAVPMAHSDKGVTYRLSSVVIYAPAHYYTLCPVFGSDGQIFSWVEYNDSIIRVRKPSQDIQDQVEQNGYLFFYSKKMQ